MVAIDTPHDHVRNLRKQGVGFRTNSAHSGRIFCCVQSSGRKRDSFCRLRRSGRIVGRSASRRPDLRLAKVSGRPVRTFKNSTCHSGRIRKNPCTSGSENRTPTVGGPKHIFTGCVTGYLISRKEVIWWMNTVVLIEVVPPRDGRRAVHLAATVSNQIARSV